MKLAESRIRWKNTKILESHYIRNVQHGVGSHRPYSERSKKSKESTSKRSPRRIVPIENHLEDQQDCRLVYNRVRVAPMQILSNHTGRGEPTRKRSSAKSYGIVKEADECKTTASATGSNTSLTDCTATSRADHIEG